MIRLIILASIAMIGVACAQFQDGFGTPGFTSSGSAAAPSDWILATNFWADSGVWIDGSNWQD